MPTLETLERFIAIVESNEHDKAIEAFYAPDASIQENQSEPRVGRDNLVNNEKKVLSRVNSMTSKCIRPYFINQDKVVIRWSFQFNWKDGRTTKIEEMAYQLWQGEHIKEEKFFFDPKQLVPK